MDAGSVIWITGLSGAGKTTIARRVADHFRDSGKAAIVLDGDEMRLVFDRGEQFDRDSRLALALSYARLCRLLADQGHTVICATISMRREVYEWNRANLPGYMEIFLDVDMSVRQGRDPKRLYARIAGGALEEFAGLDQAVDMPVSPDLHLRPTAQDSIEHTVGQVMEGIRRVRARKAGRHLVPARAHTEVRA